MEGREDLMLVEFIKISYCSEKGFSLPMSHVIVFQKELKENGIKILR